MFKRYRHGLLMLSYAVFYMIVFHFLETREVASFHILHTVFDDMIPFCEYFIVPYLLWFPYMLFTVLFFIFAPGDRREYYQLSANMIMGMTVFLVVSYLYPNMHQLRPAVLPRDNFFTGLVRTLYECDTPTNILPSIHVFNSLAIHMAIIQSERLKKFHVVKNASLVLTALIILSTMFLKQHCVIDVCLGMTMALFGYLIFYAPKEPSYERERSPRRNYSRSRKRDYEM